MSESDAMAEASEWTGRLMADRSKGALPTIFNRKNPVTKLLTMFQVEVNNQISHLFKDIPREYKHEGIAKLAGVLLQYVIGAFLYNELYENIIGRRPALDPIGMIKESFKAGKEGGTGSTVKSAGLSVLENTPFIGGWLGGGRLPVSSAMPDVPKLIGALKVDRLKPSEATKLIDQLKLIEGKGATEKKRNLLLELEGIKPKTKSLLDDLVISDVKNKVDYSSPNAFKLSQMEDAQVEKYESVNIELNMNVDRFNECYNAIKNIEGNKNEKGKTITGSAKENKIAKLVSMGLSKSDAEKFYDKTK